MKKIEQLTTGCTVTFTRKPLGSYLNVNEPYIVDAVGKKLAFFRNPVTGGETYDTASDIEFSEFTVQAAA